MADMDELVKENKIKRLTQGAAGLLDKIGTYRYGKPKKEYLTKSEIDKVRTAAIKKEMIKQIKQKAKLSVNKPVKYPSIFGEDKRKKELKNKMFHDIIMNS